MRYHPVTLRDKNPSELDKRIRDYESRGYTLQARGKEFRASFGHNVYMAKMVREPV